MKPTRLDRFIRSLFPKWGLSRIQARLAGDVLARSAYDAAGGGRRTSGWKRVSGDANTTNRGALASLREISRDLRRNNSWARRGIQSIANNTVGWGIQAKPMGSRQTAARALRLWNQWAETVACDFDGRLNFFGLQRLAMTTIVESGEVLIVRRTAPTDSTLPVPIQLRVVEPDLIDSSRDGILADTKNEVVQGIEFDLSGRRVAYYLFPRHPGGDTGFIASRSSIRVPAEDVLHVYDVNRAGQARGVPWLASVIARLHDLDDFEDAALMRQKIAACFAVFVEDFDGTATPVGKKDLEDDRLETVEPGLISYLPPGRKISVAQPPATTDPAFSAGTLRRIAVGLGITYEELTGDYSMVNFSSARMGRISQQANIHDWRWNMLIPQMCDPVWQWVMFDAVRFLRLQAVPGVEWAPPPMPLLEPEKEGLAYQRLIRSGAMTLPQVLRERGEDPATHLREIADTNKLLDELEIILDSDPRRTTTSGQAQAPVEEAPEPAADTADPAEDADEDEPEDDSEDDGDGDGDGDADTDDGEDDE